MLKLCVLVVIGASVAATSMAAEPVKTRGRLAVREAAYPVPSIDGPSLSAPVAATEALPAYLIEPTPANEPAPTPALPGDPPVPVEIPAPVLASPVYIGPTLYTNVKIKDSRRIHPCAVKCVVSAPDPCRPGCQVCVEICAPPCTPAQVTCRRCGTKIIYDFGKYEVELTARRDRVVIDYDS